MIAQAPTDMPVFIMGFVLGAVAGVSLALAILGAKTSHADREEQAAAENTARWNAHARRGL